MTTEAQYLAQALDAMKHATIPTDTWIGKIRSGAYGSKLKETWHYKAHLALSNAARATPPPAPVPPPPLPSLAGMAQNVMYTGWNPHAGVRGGPKFKLGVTADTHVAVAPDAPPDVRAAAAAAFTAAAQQAAFNQHAQGGLVACWGNQEQIGTQQIQTFGAIIQADYLIFQAETEQECATAIAAVKAGITKVVIGNSNAWTQAQRDEATALINAGRMAFCFEVYTNEGAPWPDQASSQGVPAASECIGVGWGANPSLQLLSYKPHTAPSVWAGLSVYLAEGMNEESWGLLP